MNFTADKEVSNEEGGWSKRSAALLKYAWRSEDCLLALVFVALVFLPLAEMLLRRLSFSGISGANTLIQHLTLMLGMLGGAVAARESRLLSLSPFVAHFKGWFKAVTSIFCGGFAGGISALLTLASIQFVDSERLGGKSLAYGIPLWGVQLILPFGFGLIAWRLLWRSSERWWGRLIVLGIVTSVLWIGLREPWDPERIVYPGLICLGIAAVMGLPIFAMIAGLTLLLLWANYLPIAAIPLKHYSLVTAPVLPTIPLFTLAGYFLAEGGASRRLVRVFSTMVGHIRGGPAIITALVCAYFTTFTGASGVTILALGGLLMPVLREARFSERNALGLLTASGSLGVLLPPCLPLILYSVVASGVMANLRVASSDSAGITMERMFLGGLLPGLLLIGLLSWYGVRKSPKGNASKGKFAWVEAREALWEAKWELMLPVVAIVALFGGFATPIEAAALTAFYAFFVERFIYRDLSIRHQALKVITECGLLVGGVLLILGVAMGFTNYLVTEQIPDAIVEWVSEQIHSPWVFLLALNLFLLVVGCLMDIFSAIIVVVPLIIPLGMAFGVDPIHLGIIFLANLQLGYLTPPVGMNLFLASYRFNKPMTEVIRASFPMFVILLIGVMIITYFRPLTTWLPSLF